MAKDKSLPAPRESVSRFLSFDDLHRQMDRLMEEFSHNFGLPAATQAGGAFDFRPNAELQEDDASVVARVELPGVDKKDVEINVRERSIEISGEKKSETKRKNGDRYHTERSFGSFYRTFTLPFAIDADKVDANFENGVLTVTIPKPPEAVASPRRIAIKS